MSFSVQVSRPAGKELRGLSREAQTRIAPVLRNLAADPFPHGHKKLQGGIGYRVRVGDYRVLYEVDTAAQTVTVSGIVHRKDAY